MTGAGDLYVERFLQMLAAGRDPAGDDAVEARRQGLSQLAAMAGSVGAPPCQTDDIWLDDGLRARLYRPLMANTPQPLLAYFHGGGFVAGGLDTHDGVCRRMALGSNRVVASIAYRLAPEHAFPVAHNDAVNGVRALVRRASALGVDATQLAIAGDSVGANLALFAGLTLARSKEVVIDRLGLLCPILNLDRDSPSRRRYGRGFFLEMDAARRDFELYCPDPVMRSRPEASPLLDPDLSVLPPMVIHTAELDPYLDDGDDLTAKLQALGRPVRHVQHARMIHYFYALPRLIPSAGSALDQFSQALAVEPRA